MKKAWLFVAMALQVCLVLSATASGEVLFSSRIEGYRVDSEISDAQIDSLDEWSDEEQNPPISARKAMRLGGQSGSMGT